MKTIRTPERWAEVRSHLLPLLRRVSEPAHAWYAALADPDNRLIRQPVGAMLHALVVLDLPDHRLFVNRGHLRIWGVSEAQVHRQALDNLAARPLEAARQVPAYGGLWQLSSAEGYAASRLLLPGFLEAFEAQFRQPLAIAPVGRALLLGDGADLEQVRTLVDVAERAFRSADSPLSPVVYSPGPQGVVPWSPPDDHPLTGELRALPLLLAAHEYQAQADQLADNPTIRSHIAPVELIHELGESYLRTRWERGRSQALLPAVDRVLILDGDDETEVSFAHLQAHARGCLEATRLHPLRYRARWPLPSTLEKIRQGT